MTPFVFYSLWLLLIPLLTGSSPQSNQSIQTLWQEVEKAKQDGLPKTAIECLDKILTITAAEKRHAEWLRALGEKLVLEATIQGNKPEEKVARLKQEIEKADPKVKPLLRTLLAEWYWQYYQRNRWRFMRRTATENFVENDFTTWDLKKIFTEIDTLFQGVLKEQDLLKKIPLSDFKGFLEEGSMPVELRPTLFDFIAFEALEFYSSPEQAQALPEDAFEIDSASVAFAPWEQFLTYQPPTEDIQSPRLKALRLYQELLVFHRDDDNLSARIDVDVHRLRYVKNAAFGEDKNTIYRARLEEICQQNPQLEITAMAGYELAVAWQGENELVKAYQTAQAWRDKFPRTVGGNNCDSLMKRLTAKSVELHGEKAVPPGPSKIQISYKNFDRLYFRAIPDAWDQFFKKEYGYPNSLSDEELKAVLTRKPVKEWQVRLAPTPDYRLRTTTIDVPELPPGYYRVFASWEPDFSKSPMVQHTWLWVSHSSVVSRSIPGGVDGFVLDAISGEPVSGAEVSVVFRKDRWFQFGQKVATDSDGHFQMMLDTHYWDRFLHVRAKGEELFQSDNIYSSGVSSEETEFQTLFFTDRSLYRPGQTVYFKAICVQVDHKGDNYKVVPHKSIDVFFSDPNHQEISRATLTTNDFGSCSGQFTAPADRLLGLMTLQCHNPRGAASFRVEEYKRPKFQVTVDKPEKAVKLGATVILAGKALAYTGAPVDGAAVRYRVVRRANYPYWWSWYFRPRPSSPEQEIAHGRLSTDAEGKFTITFAAKPDPKIPAKDDPQFHFQVFADVTDTAGETRSASVATVVGYSALAITLSAPEQPLEGKEVELSIRTATLDGAALSAQGSLIVSRLREPAEPIRPDLWETNLNDEQSGDQPDAQFPSNWMRWPEDKVALEKQFATKDDGYTAVKLNLPAGLYKLEALSRDAYGREVKGLLPLMILPGKDRRTFPIKLPSIAVALAGTVSVGGQVEALWGTGYEQGRCVVEVEHRQQIIKRYWTAPGTTQHLFTLPIGEEFRGGLTVHITQVRENRAYFHRLPIGVPWDNKDLELSFETFRSTLQPGEKETCRIKVKGKTGPLNAAEMVAALYDYSLDQFYAHSWSPLNFFRHDWSRISGQFINGVQQFAHWRDWWNPSPGTYEISYRHFPESITADYYYYQFANAQMAKPMAAPPAPAKAMARGAVGGVLGVTAEAADKDESTMREKKDGREAGEGGRREGEGGQAAAADALKDVVIRKNLNETAFFYPHLLMGDDGTLTIEFTMPEALTKWKFLGLAHTTDCRSGVLTDYITTRKELMVQPNPPRFLREGDTLLFTAKVVNMSDAAQEGVVRLNFRELLSDAPADAKLGLKQTDHNFNLAPHASQSFEWPVQVPVGLGPLSYTVAARAGKFSDGEAGGVPVLSSRVFVTESVPLHIRGKQTKQFEFARLKEVGHSDTLAPVKLTVQVASNPSWYAVQALPFLMEYPFECSEQVFNRYYANSLASYIANSNPRIRQVYDSWRGTDALKSNLEKNQDLKAVLLAETPWVLDAQNESQAKRNVGLLFEENTLRSNVKSALDKLKKQQLGNGSWSWFPGGRPDPFITLYIVTGFGRLRHLGVKADIAPAVQALDYLDRWIADVYQHIEHKDENNLSPIIALYLYGRSFYLQDKPIPSLSKPAVDYFLGQARTYWLKLNTRLGQGQLALALKRWGDAATAGKILASIKERSVSSEEMGMFWREDELSWWWYRAPIETQAVMIEAFSEIGNDAAAVEDCKVWLLKQKQTQDWKTTKATADAVYALLLKGTDLLASTKLVEVKLGDTLVEPGAVEPGTGFYERQYTAGNIKPEFSAIKLTKQDEGIAWGGVHFQYVEDMSKVTPHTTGLSLEKKLFVRRDTTRGPVIEPVSGALAVGDLVMVRVVLRADRDMEYVHLKDLRGSGTEPTNVLSGYRFQDGLFYYESTRDTATHFFIDYLPKGTYVFEYPLRVQLRGRYQSGLAEIQCMYAPEFNSHSGSVWMEVK